MIGVVLDTNVVVSGFLTPHGHEAVVLRLAVSGSLELYASQPILNEYETVLRRPKFRRPHELVTALLTNLRASARLLRPARTLCVCPHEPDNRFLECAEQAQADYLVTGNKRHFPERWKNTRIVNARELIEMMAPAKRKKP